MTLVDPLLGVQTEFAHNKKPRNRKRSAWLIRDGLTFNLVRQTNFAQTFKINQDIMGAYVNARLLLYSD